MSIRGNIKVIGRYIGREPVFVIGGREFRNGKLTDVFVTPEMFNKLRKGVAQGWFEFIKINNDCDCDSNLTDEEINNILEIPRLKKGLETAALEISQLKEGLENTISKITSATEDIKNISNKLAEAMGELSEMGVQIEDIDKVATKVVDVLPEWFDESTLSEV